MKLEELKSLKVTVFDFFGENLIFPIFGIRIIQSFIQGVARPMPKERNSQ